MLRLLHFHVVFLSYIIFIARISTDHPLNCQRFTWLLFKSALFFSKYYIYYIPTRRSQTYSLPVSVFKYHDLLISKFHIRWGKKKSIIFPINDFKFDRVIDVARKITFCTKNTFLAFLGLVDSVLSGRK